MRRRLHKQSRLIMRMLSFLMLTTITAARSQETSVLGQQVTRLNVVNQPIASALKVLERDVKVKFNYASSLMKESDRVSINKEGQLNEILEDILVPREIAWKYEGRNIILRRKKKEEKNSTSSPQDTSNVYLVKGVVKDKTGRGVAGASVSVKGNGFGVVTDNAGVFSIKATPDAKVVVSSVGYELREVSLEGNTDISVTLSPQVQDIKAVEVVSTGYQDVPQERVTGSFSKISNELINRSISTDILTRMKDLSAGVLFVKNELVNVRGQSTIFASTSPLIVVDNFPYDGDVRNINPNDIENITILKDAAAASIWGAKAGNGVIVINTKKGRMNQTPSLSFVSNVTVAGKPDLFYQPRMSGTEYAEVEKYLFDQGFYNDRYEDFTRPPLTPVVQTLFHERNGEISSGDASALIKSLSGQDVRNDMSRYYYRKSINQQYSININGGGQNNKYYVSAGFDKNLNTIKRDDYQRATFSANNTYYLADNKLEFFTGILYSNVNSTNAPSPSGVTFGSYALYPYARLANSDGSPAVVSRYNQAYIDTVGGGRLLDWNYRPLDELRLADSRSKSNNYRTDLSLKYKLFSFLDASVRYQRSESKTILRDLHGIESFYTRDYINQFSSIDDASGLVVRPVPLGGILDLRNADATSNSFRGQVNFSKSWGGRHAITALAGTEVIDSKQEVYTQRKYGYDNEHQKSVAVDYVSNFSNLINGFGQRIQGAEYSRTLTDRYWSYYANGSYNLDDKYSFTVSGRFDGSNLFGVDANQKIVPLWSAGLGWLVSGEEFYHISWMDRLRLRVTYGFNGNTSKNVTGYLTSTLYGNNRFGVPASTILNPPNPNLRWEKVGVLNMGAEMSMLNGRISAVADYYVKNGTDLIGDAPMPPSSGLTMLKGNTADVRTKGVDLTIESINLAGKFKWRTTALFSYTKDKVVEYKAKAPNIASYISPTATYSPRVGGAINALYSYKWGGLDPETGDPQGYYEGKISKEYSAIMNAVSEDDMIYHGSRIPTKYGSIRNSFDWNQISLSFLISYKFGYYFRRGTISYYNLFESGGDAHNDYAKRWQKPGDEQFTNVPSMIYPADFDRDNMYSLSDATVEKASNIRLEDIQLSYNLDRHVFAKLPMQNVRLNFYANNIGILWRANKSGIDPDFATQLIDLPPVRSFSLGLSANF